jgi:hypothetical protein
VHSIALQVPISRITEKGRPVIGVWTSARRQNVTILDQPGKVFSGPFQQVSRLGMPLINEVIIPLGRKDFWNTEARAADKQFAKYVANTELAGLLPVLYPGVFPNLAKLVASKKPRIDLEAILLTGVPAGIVPGFSNFTGPVPADMLRLNTKIKPSKAPNILGVLGGDLAGFPNGRRVFDDVVSVELRAIAGLTYSLIDSKFTPDAAAGEVTDGLTPSSLSMPDGTPASRTHSQVGQRIVPGGVKFAAVYPNLAAGAYTIGRDVTTPAMTVSVDGGQVTSARRPGH